MFIERKKKMREKSKGTFYRKLPGNLKFHFISKVNANANMDK